MARGRRGSAARRLAASSPTACRSRGVSVIRRRFHAATSLALQHARGIGMTSIAADAHPTIRPRPGRSRPPRPRTAGRGTNPWNLGPPAHVLRSETEKEVEVCAWHGWPAWPSSPWRQPPPGVTSGPTSTLSRDEPDLHVKTDDGSVRIETAAGAEIDARVTTEGWRIAPGEVTITESQTGDRVDIEVRLPKIRHRVRDRAPVDRRRPAGAEAGRPGRPHRRRQHRRAAGLRPTSTSRRATGASPPTASRARSACTPATGRSGPRGSPGGSRPTPATAT